MSRVTLRLSSPTPEAVPQALLWYPNTGVLSSTAFYSSASLVDPVASGHEGYHLLGSRGILQEVLGIEPVGFLAS